MAIGFSWQESTAGIEMLEGYKRIAGEIKWKIQSTGCLKVIRQ